jgi:RNA polymerase sigma-54 factor
MLELSAVELQALVHSELEQNPLLEEIVPPSTEPGKSILPDLILQKVRAEYVVTINDTVIPQLRVSEQYGSLLAQRGVPAEVRDYVRAKTDDAKRLIESLEQRRKVLLAIGRAIVEFQKGFLDNQNCGIMPMALPQVAVLAGLEETAAIHSLSNKYIETPLGVFKLSKFFPKKTSGN